MRSNREDWSSREEGPRWVRLGLVWLIVGGLTLSPAPLSQAGEDSITGADVTPEPPADDLPADPVPDDEPSQPEQPGQDTTGDQPDSSSSQGRQVDGSSPSGVGGTTGGSKTTGDSGDTSDGAETGTESAVPLDEELSGLLHSLDLDLDVSSFIADLHADGNDDQGAAEILRIGATRIQAGDGTELPAAGCRNTDGGFECGSDESVPKELIIAVAEAPQLQTSEGVAAIAFYFDDDGEPNGRIDPQIPFRYDTVVSAARSSDLEWSADGFDAISNQPMPLWLFAVRHLYLAMYPAPSGLAALKLFAGTSALGTDGSTMRDLAGPFGSSAQTGEAGQSTADEQAGGSSNTFLVLTLIVLGALLLFLLFAFLARTNPLVRSFLDAVFGTDKIDELAGLQPGVYRRSFELLLPSLEKPDEPGQQPLDPEFREVRLSFDLPEAEKVEVLRDPLRIPVVGKLFGRPRPVETAKAQKGDPIRLLKEAGLDPTIPEQKDGSGKEPKAERYFWDKRLERFVPLGPDTQPEQEVASRSTSPELEALTRRLEKLVGPENVVNLLRTTGDATHYVWNDRLEVFAPVIQGHLDSAKQEDMERPKEDRKTRERDVMPGGHGMDSYRVGDEPLQDPPGDDKDPKQGDAVGAQVGGGIGGEGEDEEKGQDGKGNRSGQASRGGWMSNFWRRFRRRPPPPPPKQEDADRSGPLIDTPGLSGIRDASGRVVVDLPGLTLRQPPTEDPAEAGDKTDYP